MLKGKNILLGVCGSIASYKSAYLTRLLVKAGANVKVIMTNEAKSFITPLTLSTLSKNPVYSDYFNEATGEWNNHVVPDEELLPLTQLWSAIEWRIAE